MKMKLSLVAAGLALAANASAVEFTGGLGAKYGFFKMEEIKEVKEKETVKQAAQAGRSAGLTFATANVGVAFPVTDMVSFGLGLDSGYALPFSDKAYNLKDGKFSTEEKQEIKDTTMSAWYVKPVAQVSVQPMDGLKLTAQGSIGELGKISSKAKDAEKAEELKRAQYGMGFNKGYGLGVAANYQINELVGVGLSYDMQTSTRAEVKADAEKDVAAQKEQNIAMHSVGLNVSFTM